MYQKPVIDHCPWPSSQFNKCHAQNKLLSSSLIVIGSSPWFTSPHTSEPLSPQDLLLYTIRDPLSSSWIYAQVLKDALTDVPHANH
jgi:hypothetical protein